MKRIFFFSTKSLHTRNNSHFFAALRNYSKFFFFFLWLPKKWPERARERILSWSDRVATKILSQLTYWGCVLHQWVWGRTQRETQSSARHCRGHTLPRMHTHISSTSVYSHMHLKNIYIFSHFCCSLHCFLTSLLFHPAVLYFWLFPYFSCLCLKSVCFT